jgi:hypothetical protein
VPSSNGDPWEWNTIRRHLDYELRVALARLWYPAEGAESKALAEPDKQRLRLLFKQFPLGQTSFETWYKQTLQQLQYNAR